MITLYIDSKDNTKIIISLKKNKIIDTIETALVLKKGSQVILPSIEKILKKHSLTISDIEAVEVNCGPGSFTGLRVGVAIANALAFSLGVSLNKKKVGVYQEPKYQ
jgi:tRNA threonylcarbamoyladenosine biosynthesis protein TsaB